MGSGRVAVFVVGAVLVACSARLVSAQEPMITVTESPPIASEADQQRLGAWFEYLADAMKRERRFAGSNQLIASSLVMGLGIWAFVRPTPSNELDKGLGLAAVTFSGTFLGIGIFQLAKKSESETRYDRWQSARGPSMTVREFGRFEGELRTQSEAADRTVRFARWTNFSIAMTGALVLGLTPVANLSSSGKTTGYVIGGVMAGFGLLGFGMSFVRSPESDYWAMYQSGRDPRPVGRRWGAAPSVGPGFYGARATVQF